MNTKMVLHPLKRMFENEYPIRSKLMNYLSATSLSMFCHAYDISLTTREKDSFLNPIRDMNDISDWIKNKMKDGHTVLLIGKDVERFVNRIKSPGMYEGEKVMMAPVTVWVAVLHAYAMPRPRIIEVMARYPDDTWHTFTEMTTRWDYKPAMDMETNNKMHPDWHWTTNKDNITTMFMPGDVCMNKHVFNILIQDTDRNKDMVTFDSVFKVMITSLLPDQVSTSYYILNENAISSTKLNGVMCENLILRTSDLSSEIRIGVLYRHQYHNARRFMFDISVGNDILGT